MNGMYSVVWYFWLAAGMPTNEDFFKYATPEMATHAEKIAQIEIDAHRYAKDEWGNTFTNYPDLLPDCIPISPDPSWDRVRWIHEATAAMATCREVANLAGARKAVLAGRTEQARIAAIPDYDLTREQWTKKHCKKMQAAYPRNRYVLSQDAAGHGHIDEVHPLEFGDTVVCDDGSFRHNAQPVLAPAPKPLEIDRTTCVKYLNRDMFPSADARKYCVDHEYIGNAGFARPDGT